MNFVEVIFHKEFTLLHRLWCENFIMKKVKGEFYPKHVGFYCLKCHAVWRNFVLTHFKDGERIKCV